VPRHRTARSAVLGVNVRRPATGKPSSRTTSALRRRIVVGVLVVLALVLITFSFRKPDDGPVASLERSGAAVLRPFTVAGERVAQPFRDAYDWTDSLLTARSDAKRLRDQNEALRQQVIQNQFAANENDKLKALLAFRDGPRFPDDYTGLAAAVIARPSGTFAQDVVVAVGSNDGVTLDAPVVSADGFLGRVTRVYSRSSRVTLLTDEQLAVSARDVKTGATGIVKHGRASASTLIFDRVPKRLKVSVGDTVVTAGWRSSKLASLYPRGIPIGRVTSVGQADTDLWKQVQVEPFAGFDRVDAVLVLVRKDKGSQP
jgi:rod shape-determining protein MreC